MLFDHIDKLKTSNIITNAGISTLTNITALNSR